MVLAGDYTWKETPRELQVRVGLRGVSAKSVDVYATETYVKISYPPYLIELDLLGDVDDFGAQAKIKKGELTLSLPKREEKVWGKLCVDVVSKGERAARRRAARERRAKREAELSEKSQVRKYEDERTAMRSQMALDAEERSAIEERKAEEKKEAEARVYETLRLVAEEETANKKNANQKDAAAPHDGIEARAADAFDIDFDAEEEEPPPLLETKMAAEEEVMEVPAPRTSAKVAVRHTPRLFPTPIRESKLAEEHAWISKHRAHLHKNAMLSLGTRQADARGIEETDPTWLKSRGDELYRAGDARAAIEAYTAALEIDPELAACLANRAACQLKLGDFQACVADCSAALTKFGQPTHVEAKLQAKLRARRAAAECGLGDYSAAVDDLRCAAALDGLESSIAEDLRRDVQRTERLRDASAFKAAADAELASGKAQAAVNSYSAALDAEPSFVSALANRAAARLVVGDLNGAIADCTDALALFECNADPDNTVSGPLPPRGTDKRRHWVLRTLARRGAAYARLGNLDAAVLDYESAATLAPDDVNLKGDLDKLRTTAKERAERDLPLHKDVSRGKTPSTQQ